jgi:replicative DNA helicase
LDDSKYEIIPRIIAMDQMIPISVASKPQRFKKRIDNGEENSAMYHEWLEKRNQGLTKLKNMNNLFKIMDSTKIKSAEGIYECMKQLQVYVKAIDPKMNIIAAIDSVNDIKFRDRYFNSTADKHAAIAQTVKEWAVELNIPIFGSIHLRKLNQNRRPALDDLKESGEYVYEASVTFLIHNDVSKNKQAAKIYSTSEQFEGKRPIIEIDWAKNKKSSYKGRTYCYFTPEYSQVVECGQDASRRFDALIYEG